MGNWLTGHSLSVFDSLGLFLSFSLDGFLPGLLGLGFSILSSSGLTVLPLSLVFEDILEVRFKSGEVITRRLFRAEESSVVLGEDFSIVNVL